MNKYCENCDRDVDTKIVTKDEEFIVQGEKILVNTRVCVCKSCGEELFDPDLDNETLNKVYDKYRRIHKLLSPKEIAQIRKQYGLSQRSFSKLLNWGEKTIHRYENGALQDKAHNTILCLLREPSNMLEYIDSNEINITDNQKKKLMIRIEELMNGENHIENNAYRLLFSYDQSIESGYKRFDYDKLCAMILFFVKCNRNLMKVKLLKLLNYSDMVFYKENGISISGLKYLHLTYGPVPMNYEVLFQAMENDDVFHVDIDYYNDYECHRIVSDKDISADILSKKEIKVLNRVNEKFKDMGSRDISDYSHKEKGYSSTRTGEIISYAYAEDINL